MAARVTAEEVKAIIQDAATDMAGDTLAPFIMMATKLTDRVVAADEAEELDEEMEKEIERLLAAHFSCIKYVRNSDEKAGTVGESKMYKVDLGLNVTLYGQQAIVLDPTGVLAAIADGSLTGGAAIAEVLSINGTRDWDEYGEDVA
jgi:hypothetical protein